jgi:hypothetical protein
MFCPHLRLKGSEWAVKGSGKYEPISIVFYADNIPVCSTAGTSSYRHQAIYCLCCLLPQVDCGSGSTVVLLYANARIEGVADGGGAFGGQGTHSGSL